MKKPPLKFINDGFFEFKKYNFIFRQKRRELLALNQVD